MFALYCIQMSERVAADNDEGVLRQEDPGWGPAGSFKEMSLVTCQTALVQDNILLFFN